MIHFVIPHKTTTSRTRNNNSNCDNKQAQQQNTVKTALQNPQTNGKFSAQGQHFFGFLSLVFVEIKTPFKSEYSEFTEVESPRIFRNLFSTHKGYPFVTQEKNDNIDRNLTLAASIPSFGCPSFFNKSVSTLWGRKYQEKKHSSTQFHITWKIIQDILNFFVQHTQLNNNQIRKYLFLFKSGNKLELFLAQEEEDQEKCFLNTVQTTVFFHTTGGSRKLKRFSEQLSRRKVDL